DGKRIVFIAQESARIPMRIYLVEADGGTPRPAVPSDRGSQSDPTWSPIGNRLLYGLNLQSAREAAYIRMADLDQGTVTKFPGSDGLFAPRWSPDGKTVVALERDSRRRMTVYRFGEDVWRPLTGSRADFPNFSRDSKRILFRAGDVLKELHIDNGREENVLQLKNEEIGGFLHSIGRSGDDGPTRTLNRDSRQIYELYFQMP